MQKIIDQLPQSIVDLIGNEWQGTYRVRLLSAREYLDVTEKLIQQLRDEKGDTWDGTIPTTLSYRAIVYAASTKDGAALPDELPAKLYELLAAAAIPMNTLNLAEQQELFKSFRVEP